MSRKKGVGQEVPLVYRMAEAAEAARRVIGGYAEGDRRRGMAAAIVWWDCESCLGTELSALPGGRWWGEDGEERLEVWARTTRRERREAALAVRRLWAWAYAEMKRYLFVFECDAEVMEALRGAGWVFHARCKDVGRENRERGGAR